jgi:hypothetical protein
MAGLPHQSASLLFVPFKVPPPAGKSPPPGDGNKALSSHHE